MKSESRMLVKTWK